MPEVAMNVLISIISVLAILLGGLGFNGLRNAEQSYVSATQQLKIAEQKIILGGLAPLPGAVVEGTSTAGWTDDGSIVRLNTAADNVGIGTADPATKLQVQGVTYGTGNLRIGGGTFDFSNGLATVTLTTISGQLGVATTTPRATLAVGGNLMTSGTSTFSTLIIASSSAQIRGVNYILPTGDGTDGQALLTNGSGVLSFGTVSTASLGTSTPAATFAVQGNAFISGTTTVGILFATSSVRIATTTSQAVLAVQGNAIISGTTTVGNLVATSSCTGCGALVQSYIPRMPGAATTTSVSMNSGGTIPVNASQFEIPFRQTFQKISYNASSQINDAGMDVKIFAENGTTVVLATTTGAATVVGVNTITASSTFTLNPGIYWIAFMPHPPGLIYIDLWSYLANPFIALNNVSGEPRVVCQYARTALQFKLPGVIDIAGCSVTEDVTQLGGLIFRLDN